MNENEGAARAAPFAFWADQDGFGSGGDEFFGAGLPRPRAANLRRFAETAVARRAINCIKELRVDSHEQACSD